MSSDEFLVLLSKYKDLSSSFEKLQKFLSQKEVGLPFFRDTIQDFVELDSESIDDSVQILIGEKWLIESNIYICSTCENILSENFCDLCLKKDCSPEFKSGLTLLKIVPMPVEWSDRILELNDLDDFSRAIIQVIPRVCLHLFKNPPSYITNLRNGTSASCKEENYRDDVRTSFVGSFGAEAEIKVTRGRVDLVLTPINGALHGVIGEFKVWGGTGYKDVLDQLLGYCTPFQSVGFIFMINNNQGSITEKYRSEIIGSNSSLVENTISSNPVVQSPNWPHFSSRHKSAAGVEITVFHFIFDVQSNFLFER